MKVVPVVIAFLLHMMPGSGIIHPESLESDYSLTKLSQLEPTIYGNSISSSPVNVPVPTINFYSNGGTTAAANYEAGVHTDHHTLTAVNYFSFSGNPVFPHATDSPRLHLACRVMRI